MGLGLSPRCRGTPPNDPPPTPANTRCVKRAPPAPMPWGCFVVCFVRRELVVHVGNVQRVSGGWAQGGPGPWDGHFPGRGEVMWAREGGDPFAPRPAGWRGGWESGRRSAQQAEVRCGADGAGRAALGCKDPSAWAEGCGGAGPGVRGEDEMRMRMRMERGEWVKRHSESRSCKGRAGRRGRGGERAGRGGRGNRNRAAVPGLPVPPW